MCCAMRACHAVQTVMSHESWNVTDCDSLGQSDWQDPPRAGPCRLHDAAIADVAAAHLLAFLCTGTGHVASRQGPRSLRYMQSDTKQSNVEIEACVRMAPLPHSPLPHCYEYVCMSNLACDYGCGPGPHWHWSSGGGSPCCCPYLGC